MSSSAFRRSPKPGAFLVAAEHRRLFIGENLSSGLPELGALFGGGPLRGTCTLITGPAGSGGPRLYRGRYDRNGIASTKRVVRRDQLLPWCTMWCPFFRRAVRRHGVSTASESRAMIFCWDCVSRFCRSWARISANRG
jgi:hypothetical protein